MFNAGAVMGTLGLDTSGFATGMLQSESLMQLFPGWVNSFMANPLLGIANLAKDAMGAVAGAVKGVGQEFDDAGEAAERVGVSVSFLTSVGKVAADAGSSVQGFGDALKFLGNNAADAAAGNKTAAENFAAIGVSATDANGKIKNSEQLFYEVADAISGLGTSAQKTQASMNLMGRGGTEMIPVMNKGSAEIQKMAGTIASLGGAVSEQEAAWGDAWGTMTTLFQSAWNGIKKAIATPILKWVSDHAAELTERLSGLATMIQEGVATAFEVLAPLAQGLFDLWRGIGRETYSQLIPALNAVGAVLKVIFQILQPILSAIGAVFGGIGRAIQSVTGGLGLTTNNQQRGMDAMFGDFKPAGDVNVQVNLDPKATAQQIGDAVGKKLAPEIEQSQRRLKSAAESETLRRRAAAGMGGR